MFNLNNILRNEFFLGSLILMILINTGNVITYVLHFSMARLLGPVDYGIFAVLTNIIFIFSMPAVSIQTLISKYTTRYNLKKDFGRIRGIFSYLMKESLVISAMLYVAFLIISLYVYKQLKISFFLLALTGIFLFIAFTYPILIGILQGMKRFNAWGWNYVISCFIKLVIAVLLVTIGFRVYGAIIGFILGNFISFLMLFPLIKEILHSKKIESRLDIFSRESLPTVLSMLVIVIMYSMDIILAKIFFNPEIAGKYAIASLLGKTIWFAASAVGNAMFPISSEKYETGKKSRGVMTKTYFAVIFICITAVFILATFPEFIIKILFDARYLDVANILSYIGIGFSFFSLLNIHILHKISVDKLRMRHVFILAILMVLQFFVLLFVHSSLESFSILFMISNIIIFIASILFIQK
ncbi:oligosaccharide flippase family protein [Candidatus Pacearchaeota archaeon]|nr:oligosaccharide flippase family protein [Candidatus Pacearchaeota archaeon]